MQEDSKSIDDYLQYLYSQAIDPLPSSLINTPIGKSILSLDALNGGAFFSGLMLRLELASNHNMLNALVFFVLGYGKGENTLSREIAEKLFLELKETYYQRMEDPTEDVFVSLVYFGNENYKIVQGLWADNDFFLQIFLDILNNIQNSPIISKLFLSIKALLKLSDLMIHKSELERYSIGNELPLTEIPKNLLKDIEAISSTVKFSRRELIENGINPDNLSAFIYNFSQRNELLSSSISSSPLELKPIVEHESHFYFMLPSAIGLALKHLIFDFFLSSGNKIALRTLMQHKYLEHFSNRISFLGLNSEGTFTPILNNAGIIIGQSTVIEIDQGRFFHAQLIFDDFDGYETSGFTGVSPNATANISHFENNIRSVYHAAIGIQGFREGLTLIISCGWGRAIGLPQILPNIESWSTEFISAPDLTTFSYISEMTAIKFLQFIKAKRAAENTGIQIKNLSGLLNLYAFAESNNFHIIPHTQLPDGLTPATLDHYQMLIESNFLLDIRSRVRLNWDSHNEINPDGKVIHVKRLGSDLYFDEDKFRPVYASVDDVKNGELVGIIKSKRTNYWNLLALSKNDNSFMNFEIWQALCYWIHKIGILLDEQSFIPLKKTVVWKWEFEGLLPTETKDVPTYEELLLLAESTANINNEAIYVTSSFKPGFLMGFHHESNQGEKAMIHIFLKSLLSCVVSSDSLVDITYQCMSQIFSNPNAKSFHVLHALHYRDHIEHAHSKPIYISELDAGRTKIGLGWIARDVKLGSNLVGVRECTKFLNDLVFKIWLNLKENLSQFDKTVTLLKLLNNHELIADDSKRWERTFKATLESHEAKANITQKVIEQIGIRNSSLLGTRILIEMALCECQNEGGVLPGSIDISEMLVNASLIFSFGGWSDIIKYEMIPAEVKISPAGDVLLDHTFNNSVIEPYGRESQENILLDSIQNYSNYYGTEILEPPPVEFESIFQDAWIDEYGFSVDDGAKLLNAIFQIGIEKSQLVFILDEEEFLSVIETHELPKILAENFLKVFTLLEREDWLSVPSGFVSNDIFPWRFRRRLSVVLRPILKVGSKLFFTPGLLSDGFAYLVRGCWEASFDETFFKSKLMRSWIGSKRNAAGHQFNKDVANAFQVLGWKAEPELKLTKILKKNLDKNYGDIDVVAWNTDTREVLLIECKDLEVAKNQGEIAKQSYEFRGELRENGKPDRLLKHMERIRVITENEDALRNYTGIDEKISIQPALLFSRLVPMKFLNSENLSNFKIFLFDELSVVEVHEDQ